MRSRIVFSLAAMLFLCGMLATLYAQSSDGGAQAPSDRVDLKTGTWVGKRLERTENGPDGQKIYHYTYRVEARATARDLPRHIVDHRYSITHGHTGFKSGDSITLLSTNEESETDSPIWVYDVTYVGSGRRTIVFSTSGSVVAPVFMMMNGETVGNCVCVGCQFRPSCNPPCYIGCNCSHCPPCNCSGCQTRSPRCYTCPRGCSCAHCTQCNCSGCQSLNPKCTSCPRGCTCSHCRCACSGCLSRIPPCTSCPPGCYCSHCGCRCADDVDHYGVCGCVSCVSPTTPCRCECHTPCP